MLDQIIRDLSDDTKPLTSILLRLKVLLADINQPRLVEFVNYELNGYPNENELPAYRVLPGQARGTVACIAWRMPDHPLPTFHLTEQDRYWLEHVEVRESLASIEELLASREDDLAKPIPVEFNSRFSEVLQSGVHIDLAWIAVGRPSMKNISAQVRSRLLDFLLEVRSVVGKGANEEQIKEKVEGLDIKAAFQGTVFGDNTTINFGHNSEISISNTSIKKIEQLYQELAKAGLPPGDVAELGQAIEHDGGKPNMNGETGKWYARLLGKIGDGALKVGMDVATTKVIDLLIKAAGISPT